MSSHQNSSSVPQVDPSSTTNTYTGRYAATPGGAALMMLITLIFLFLIVLYVRAKYSPAGTTIDDHFPARPLDPSFLKALPVSVFPSEDFKLKGVPGVEYSCAVCLSEFAVGEEARVLPRCRHGFHVECIDMWFHSNSTCPLCRLPVALASSVQPTVGSLSPARAEVSSKIVDPESTTCVVVNIDEGCSSSSPSPSLSSSSSLACSTMRRVLSSGSDMLVEACNGSRGSDIEEGVLGVPIPNSSM